MPQHRESKIFLFACKYWSHFHLLSINKSDQAIKNTLNHTLRDIWKHHGWRHPFIQTNQSLQLESHLSFTVDQSLLVIMLLLPLLLMWVQVFYSGVRFSLSRPSIMEIIDKAVPTGALWNTSIVLGVMRENASRRNNYHLKKFIQIQIFTVFRMAEKILFPLVSLYNNFKDVMLLEIKYIEK